MGNIINESNGSCFDGVNKINGVPDVCKYKDAASVLRCLKTDIVAIIESGTWFWKKNSIGDICDNSGSVTDVTRIINPGLSHLSERQTQKLHITSKFIELFGGCAND